MIDYKANLEQAIYALEARMGKFLMTGSEIAGLQNRARQYVQSPNAEVRSKANAVLSKATGLLGDFKDIQIAGLAAANKAATLRAEVERDPLWKNILSANWNTLGWETLKQARLMVGRLTGTVSETATTLGRVNRHLANVEGLQADMSDLDAYAQGKGVTRRLDSFFGSLDSTAKMTLGIGVAAVAGFYLLPMGLKKAARA